LLGAFCVLKVKLNQDALVLDKSHDPGNSWLCKIYYYNCFVLQDFLLCGIYGRTEAMHGNIEQARKIFDMALLSTEATAEVKL
jgi:hypothetical protein